MDLYLYAITKAYDIGESIYVHVFGAYFGLAVAKCLQEKRETDSKKEGSEYHSDIFSMIGICLIISILDWIINVFKRDFFLYFKGTLFLWLYWV